MFKKIIKAFIPFGVLQLFYIIKSDLKTKSHFIKKIEPLKKQSEKSPLFIVSLTSYGKRVKTKAPYAIDSLFKQSVQSDKIVLWLAHGTKINRKLKQLEKLGLEIRFCEDIKSYKKLIPALTEFPNDILITVDDDNYYHHNWLKMLKDAYLSNPTKIYCHIAHEICLDENKNIIPYSQWRKNVNTIEYPRRLLPVGVGGILYPPHSFNDEVLNKAKFQMLAPTADDIWFWAMARYNGKEHALVKNCIYKITNIGKNDDGLLLLNVINNKNDEQIKNVIKEYPEVYKNIL